MSQQPSDRTSGNDRASRKSALWIGSTQFIATTHSALVVGGMEGRQEMRFVREQGRTVLVPVTDEMLWGRADQILTGRLFDMKTTLDKNTQESIEVYKGLLGKRSRTPQEQADFVTLDDELKYER